MSRTYSEHEALQAVVAALAFHDLDVAKAASRGKGQTTLTGRMGYTFKVSEGARELLAKAEKILSVQGTAVGMYDDLPLTSHDLTRAIPDGRTPQERTRDEIYARGNRWQMENYEQTH